MMQPVHEGRVALDMNHDISVLGLELIREVRQAIGPDLSDRILADRLVWRDRIEQHGIIRIIGNESIEVFGFQSLRPGSNQSADGRFVLGHAVDAFC